MKTYSLLRRILVSLTALVLLATLCGLGWLYLKTEVIDRRLREQTLLDQAKVIGSHLSETDDGTLQVTLPPTLQEAYLSRDSRYRYAIRDSSGQILLDSGTDIGALPRFLTSQPKLYDYDPDGRGPLHVYGATFPMVVGTRHIVVQIEERAYEDSSSGKAALAEFVADGGWLQLVSLAFILLISAVIIRRALEPLKRISDLAEGIDPSNADMRLPESGIPVEILPLVRSFNAALNKLDEGLKRQREFNANAAHQLRTPLAVLLANLELSAEPALTARVRPDIDHMARIISQLLLVARFETLPLEVRDIIELNEFVSEIAASFGPLAIAAGKTIELIATPDPVWLKSSGFALKAAVGNLIENGLKHANTRVRLCVHTSPSLDVIDDGPGVAVEAREKVFERFWRGDRAGIGAGLGLSIVSRIMTLLSGSVSLKNSDGPGATFTIRFSDASRCVPERNRLAG